MNGPTKPGAVVYAKSHVKRDALADEIQTLTDRPILYDFFAVSTISSDFEEPYISSTAVSAAS